MKSMKQDHYVSDNGEIVYYQTDPKLFNLFLKKDEWLFSRDIFKKQIIYHLLASTNISFVIETSNCCKQLNRILKWFSWSKL